MRNLTPTFLCALLTGCIGNVHLVGIGDEAVCVLEKDRRVSLYPVSISYSRGFAYLDQYLVEQAPAATSMALAAIVYGSPPWRRIQILSDTATWISHDQSAGRTKWIIGTNPLIVALGDGTRSAGQSSYPKARNRGEIVDTLLILDPWREFPGCAAGENPQLASPPETRQIIKLQQPLSIEQVQLQIERESRQR